MSCGKDAKACGQTASRHGQPAAVAAWAEGRAGGGHCDKCGGFLDSGGVCHNPRCGGEMLRLTAREDAMIEEGVSLAKFLGESGVDPLNNEGVKRLHQNYVSISTGKARRVILDPNVGTAATNMRGAVYLNPYPLGAAGNVIDQLIVSQAYIDHELGHELFTPVGLLDTTRAIAEGEESLSVRGRGGARWKAIHQAAADLSPDERKLLHTMVNVVEDARMERVIEQREPYMWKRLLAGQLVQPKDESFRAGGMAEMVDYEQVLWATQVVGQSNYRLTEDIQRGMSAAALEAIRDLMPVIDRGVRGTAYDAVEASVAIVRDLKRRGMLDGDVSLMRPEPAGLSGSAGADGEAAPGADSPSVGGDEAGGGGEAGGDEAGGEDGSGEAGGESGGGGIPEKCPKCGRFLDKDGQCRDCGGEAGDKASPPSPATSDDSGGGGSSGKGGDSEGLGELPPEKPMIAPGASESERLAKQREEARAMLTEMRDTMTGQYCRAVKKLIGEAETHLAKKLAETPGKSSRRITMPLQNSDGETVSRSFTVHPHQKLPQRRIQDTWLEAGREAINRGAAKMASRLKRMKQKVDRNAYLQRRGAFDRRRTVAAVKGSDRVRMQQASRHDTSMAVSMSIDISGSMGGYIQQLGTITGIIGRGLERANVPYELRAYDTAQYHIKGLNERKISDEQVKSLYIAGGDNCDAPSIAMGGHALQTRDEVAKVQFVLTDGEPQSFVDRSYGRKGMKEVKQAVDANREKGILTMGIFFAGPSRRSRESVKGKFDYMYGRGGWMYVPDLENVPDVVTGTLEKQLAKFLPDW